MKQKAKVISTKNIYEGKWLSLREDKFIKPDGTEASYEVVKRGDLVIIIPQIEENIYLVEQYRYAFDNFSLEFPQGFIEKNEEPKDAAIRELKEETGLEGRLTFLGSICTSSGFLEQTLYVFTGNKFKNGLQKLDLTEADLKKMLLPINKFKDMVRKNKVKNGPTLAAFTLFLLNS